MVDKTNRKNDAILHCSTSAFRPVTDRGHSRCQWRIWLDALKRHHKFVYVTLQHPSNGRSWRGMIPAELLSHVVASTTTIAANPDGSPKLMSHFGIPTKYGSFFFEVMPSGNKKIDIKLDEGLFVNMQKFLREMRNACEIPEKYQAIQEILDAINVQGTDEQPVIHDIRDGRFPAQPNEVVEEAA